MSTFSKITYHISAILALALDSTVFPFVAGPLPSKYIRNACCSFFSNLSFVSKFFCLPCLLRSSLLLLFHTILVLPTLYLLSLPSPRAPLVYTLSNLSTSCSLLILELPGVKSDLLYSCSTRDVQAGHPYVPLSTCILKKAADVSDLVYALASSPDFKSTMSNEGTQDVRLVFECLVRRIMFQYCYRELSFTAYSYQQAVEYLTDRPIELAVKHKQYRKGVAQLEQAAKAAAVAEVRKRKAMSRSASSVALSMFKPKKKRLVAK